MVSPGIGGCTIPLLASPQGGVAASSKKFRAATEPDAAGVVFLCVLTRKTTPASRSADASQHFINRSATPPCGDARRGIGSILIVCQVPVRISSGSDALVHLDELDGIPLDVFACQCVKHQPRSAAAAQTCDEAAPRSYRSPGFRCNENSGRARGCCGIGKYFDLHRRTSFSVGHSLLAAPCRGLRFARPAYCRNAGCASNRKWA